MSDLRKSLVLTVALALGVGALTPGAAHAQAGCDWYARTAIKQQQDNERLNCKQSGEDWHADMQRHLRWCQSVPPDAWKAAAQRREQRLAACAKK